MFTLLIFFCGLRSVRENEYVSSIGYLTRGGGPPVAPPRPPIRVVGFPPRSSYDFNVQQSGHPQKPLSDPFIFSILHGPPASRGPVGHGCGDGRALCPPDTDHNKCPLPTTPGPGSLTTGDLGPTGRTAKVGGGGVLSS